MIKNRKRIFRQRKLHSKC